MNSKGGWMTTKKSGHDDRAIAAAKKTALEKRRAKRGLVPAKPKKRRTMVTTRGKVIGKNVDSESEESLFSVNNDESEEEEDVVLSEEESSDNDIDDDDDDGPAITFMKVPKGKKTSFTVKPMLEESTKLKRKARANGYRAKTRNNDNDDAESSDQHSDDSPIEKPKQRNKTTVAPKNKKRYETLSSDDEVDSLPPPSNVYKKSKYFAQKSNTTHALSSDDDDTPAKPTRAKQAARKRVIANDDDDDDDDDDPSDNNVVVLSPIPATKPRQRKPSSLELLGRAERDGAKVDQRKSSCEAQGFDSDDFVDEDEALAIAEAMKKSMQDGVKTTKKQRFRKLGQKSKHPAKSHSRTNKSKTRNENIKAESSSSAQHEDDFLMDSDEDKEPKMPENPIDVMEVPSSDDDDDDEPGVDDQDVYMDEDAKEASVVLAAANELSASVLRIMTSWASDLNGAGGGAPGTMTVPQGMIVDGAIAMASLQKDPGKVNNKTGNKSSGHSWISNEVMRQVLPNLTLSEYQLIGVNWLALLHNMTYTVANGKPSNVNGILADEMGLGKTCQTIAFLAWLKHSRNNGASYDGEERLTKQDHAKDVDLSEHEGSDDEKEPEVFHVDEGRSIKKQRAAEVSIRRTDEESSPDARLPHLIIVPASVVENWEREFQTFAPDLKVVKFHGTQEERIDVKHELRAYLLKQKGAPEVDVILASISNFQQERSEVVDFLRKFKFDYLVVDEGHLLKNAKGRRYKNLDSFRTLHRLLLTGTPVQNSPQELMALLCFLMPLFSRKTSSDFEEEETYKGESMLRHFVSLEESAGNKHESSHEFAYRKLKQLFAPFVLRRRKKEVLSQIIPPKTYQVEMVTLDEKARAQYNAVIDAHVRAKKNKTNRASDHLFTKLRKAAHHPLLLRHRYTSKSEIDHLTDCFHQFGAFTGHGSTKERIAAELEGFSDFEIHLTAHELLDQNPHASDKLTRYILSKEDLFASAKFVRLREMLPALIDDGHRILIFSCWTMCLDLLGCLMEELGLDFRRMDGATVVADRQELIDEFNNTPSIPVFLLSTKACGVGINLTSADVCIMHDIDMNPFSDHQAEARCHRIGQSKPVRIIKLIAKDTVDSAIYEMQERKVKMNAAIMESPSEWTKEEKKEKALILQAIVGRHTKGTPEAEPASAGKENTENAIIEVSDENEECLL